MNKSEELLADELKRRQHAGLILEFRFEEMTFVLPGGVRYTPDFVVQETDRTLTCVELKGSAAIFMDDAKAKFRIARGHFPWFRFVAVAPRAKKAGGGWAVIGGEGGETY